jgi:hypothetical protein
MAREGISKERLAALARECQEIRDKRGFPDQMMDKLADNIFSQRKRGVNDAKCIATVPRNEKPIRLKDEVWRFLLETW